MSPHHLHITHHSHFTTAVTSHHITQPRSFWAASDLTTSRTSHIHRSHITSQITHITHISQKSSHLTTSHITSRKKRTRRRSSWAEFLGRMAHHTTSHQITHHKPKEENTKKKFLGRVLGPDGSPHHISPDHTSQAERREHKEEVLGPFLGRMTHHTTTLLLLLPLPLPPPRLFVLAVSDPFLTCF